LANPIVLKSSSIDVILGIDWLSPRKAIIRCETGTVHLTSKSGEEVVCKATTMTTEVCGVNQMNGATMDKTKVVNEFLDVFPDDLPGMPPDWDIEIIIELLLGTAPIVKRPYRIGVNELEELKKQLKELQDKGFIRPSSSPWGAPVIFVDKKDGT
jgi:hypothetical protein